MQTRNLFTQAHALLVYHNLHGDPFFVKKVKRWCLSALEREYLKTHSRDIMPAYSPTDKQVNEKPDEHYTENLFFYYLKVLSVFAACPQIVPWEGLHAVKDVFLIKLGNHLTHILPQHDPD